MHLARRRLAIQAEKALHPCYFGVMISNDRRNSLFCRGLFLGRDPIGFCLIGGGLICCGPLGCGRLSRYPCDFLFCCYPRGL